MSPLVLFLLTLAAAAFLVSQLPRLAQNAGIHPRIAAALAGLAGL